MRCNHRRVESDLGTYRGQGGSRGTAGTKAHDSAKQNSPTWHLKSTILPLAFVLFRRSLFRPLRQTGTLDSEVMYSCISSRSRTPTTTTSTQALINHPDKCSPMATRSLLSTKPQYLCQYVGLGELRVTSSSARVRM